MVYGIGHNSGHNPAAYAPSVFQLGSDLRAYWDMEHPSLILRPSNLITSWIDAVSGINLTASGSASPTHSTTAFNGRRGAVFNGTANCLVATTGLGSLPTGADGSESWFLLDVTAPVSDTTARSFGMWGTTNGNDSRRTYGAGDSSIYQAKAQVGTGAGTGSNTNAANIFGRHLIRHVVEPTQTWIEVDGVASVPTAVVPNTGAARIRMGAVANASASSFLLGIMAAWLITSLLTADQASLVRSCFVGRLQ